MKICPQCQTAYDDSKNFCHHDGASLATPQASEKGAPSEDLTCSQCGKLKEAGEQFCSQCGAKLEGISSPAAHKNPLTRPAHKLQSLITDYYQQLPPERSEFHRGAALGFGAAILIMLGFIGYWKAQGSSQVPASQQEPSASAKPSVPPPPQDQVLSSSFARVVKQPDETKTSEAPTDRLPAAGTPPEGQPASGGASLPPQEPYAATTTPPEPPQADIPPGMYRVTTLTALRSEPYDDAPVVTQLKSGIKIQVVGAVGDYLEVHSKKGRTPGYVLREHAVLVQRDNAGK